MLPLLAILGLLLGSPAAAAIIELDLVAPGDGWVTRDTGAGLDWLDLTVTKDLAFQDVADGAGGWADEGWRAATSGEVCDLFLTLGAAPSPCPGVAVIDGPVGAVHLSFLGITTITPSGSEQFWGFFDDGGDPMRVGVVEFSVERPTGSLRTYIAVRPSSWDAAQSASDNGVFLVRAIPEPSSAALLLIGLAGLCLRRRIH